MGLWRNQHQCRMSTCNDCPIEQWKEEYPEIYEKTIQGIPLQRFGDAEKDIGGTCLFLASEAASYISGETITLQGGSGLRP